MPNIHPLIVHFPLALLVVGLMFELAYISRKKEEYSRVGWWMQLIGTLGLAATVTSGLFAEHTVTIGPLAKDHFETHEEIAFIVAAIFALLILWRFSARTHLPQKYRVWFVSLYALGVALLVVGAWYGGEMVYRFGVGVR